MLASCLVYLTALSSCRFTDHVPACFCPLLPASACLASGPACVLRENPQDDEEEEEEEPSSSSSEDEGEEEGDGQRDDVDKRAGEAERSRGGGGGGVCGAQCAGM